MWGTCCARIELPDPVVEMLTQGALPQAPTLREMRGDDGSRFAVLDLMLEVPAAYLRDLDQEHRVLGFDWGVRSLITVSILEKPERDVEEKYRQISRPVFLDSGGLDGRQAKLRREIDRLKACRERYVKLVKAAVIARVEHKNPLPAHVALWQEHIDAYEARIKLCWKKYEKRNRELAHLACNLLILLALLYDCRLICGENLTTLKTIGRGGEYAGGSAIGAITRRSEASSGGCSRTSVICWGFEASMSRLVARPIRVRAVMSQRKPIAHPIQRIARRLTTGHPGSAVAIPTASGMGHAIMLLPSILPGWVWRFCSPITRPRGTRRTA
ncbi:MAG: hypothetical protein ACXVCM_24310, partial [Ktedonobacteraceae bacterium]